jgi:hypothetical protein
LLPPALNTDGAGGAAFAGAVTAVVPGLPVATSLALACACDHAVVRISSWILFMVSGEALTGTLSAGDLSTSDGLAAGEHLD